jgi:hypothetical protein
MVTGGRQVTPRSQTVRHLDDFRTSRPRHRAVADGGGERRALDADLTSDEGNIFIRLLKGFFGLGASPPTQYSSVGSSITAPMPADMAP